MGIRGHPKNENGAPRDELKNGCGRGWTVAYMIQTWALAATLPNSDLNFAMDFGVDFLFLVLHPTFKTFIPATEPPDPRRVSLGGIPGELIQRCGRLQLQLLVPMEFMNSYIQYRVAPFFE